MHVIYLKNNYCKGKFIKKLPPIALGTWSWGSGFAGGDQVFGNHLDVKSLKPVFDTAMKEGLNLWDTAAVYGRGHQNFY